MDNVAAALEHHDRISDLGLCEIPNSQLGKVLEAMQQPFPELTYLMLAAAEGGTETAPVLPASFLGGSAPRLEALFLDRIPLPGLINLLLSATHLDQLALLRIPHSGYISPEAMATCLSVLTRLEELDIGFEVPQSLPERFPPPQRRVLLPVLNQFWFSGSCEYLEDLVAQIDAPLLDDLNMLLHEGTFNTPQLDQFVSRTKVQWAS
jgi:hypothetical protein